MRPFLSVSDIVSLSYHSIAIDLEIDHDMDPVIAERLIHDR
jgi:hypothetical protein